MHVAAQLAQNALTAAGDSVASRYLDTLREIPELAGVKRESFVRAAKWYGLLHDLGHLPYSHLTEECMKLTKLAPYPEEKTFGKAHEAAGHWLIRNDADLKRAMASDPHAAWMVTKMLSSKEADPTELVPLKDIVDSDVDADRIDSTARDGVRSGGDVGRYDLLRLQQSSILVAPRSAEEKWRILLTTRAIHAIESLLFERYKLYRWIHYHPKVVAYKNAMRHLFGALRIKAKDLHASAYVRKDGFLDDTWLRNRIANAPEHKLNDSQNAARRALLFRTHEARSLWKRRDEYRAMNERIESDLDVSQSSLLASARENSLPLLYVMAQRLASLEPLLNARAAERGMTSRFAVCGLEFRVFESQRLTRFIAKFQVAKHGAPDQRLCLTDESQVMVGIGKNAHGEPALGVTILGDPERKEQSALEEIFVQAAREIAKR